MCGGPTKKTTHYLSNPEVWFDGSTETFDPKSASKECKCTIGNTQEFPSMAMYMQVLDMRMESHVIGDASTSARCSSADFKSERIATRCGNSSMHWRDNFHYHDRELNTESYSFTLNYNQRTEIRLTDIHKNGAWDSPAMVWLRFGK